MRSWRALRRGAQARESEQKLKAESVGNIIGDDVLFHSQRLASSVSIAMAMQAGTATLMSSMHR